MSALWYVRSTLLLAATLCLSGCSGCVKGGGATQITPPPLPNPRPPYVNDGPLPPPPVQHEIIVHGNQTKDR